MWTLASGLKVYTVGAFAPVTAQTSDPRPRRLVDTAPEQAAAAKCLIQAFLCHMLSMPPFGGSGPLPDAGALLW